MFASLPTALGFAGQEVLVYREGTPMPGEKSESPMKLKAIAATYHFGVLVE